MTHRIEKTQNKSDKPKPEEQKSELASAYKIQLQFLSGLIIQISKDINKILKPIMIQYGPIFYSLMLFMTLIYLRSY